MSINSGKRLSIHDVIFFAVIFITDSLIFITKFLIRQGSYIMIRSLNGGELLAVVSKHVLPFVDPI